MAKFSHADVLDNGPAYLKANATHMYLIKAYTAADSFATVSGNKLGQVAVSSADYALSSSGNNRLCTVGAKTITAASASSVSGDNLHVAHVDATNSKVLAVTDETTDQVITAGNPVDLPTHAYGANQPT